MSIQAGIKPVLILINTLAMSHIEDDGIPRVTVKCFDPRRNTKGESNHLGND